MRKSDKYYVYGDGPSEETFLLGIITSKGNAYIFANAMSKSYKNVQTLDKKRKDIKG
jgi:deoxyxylulose-5-phosphate synthase